MPGQTGLANITWQLNPDDHAKINGDSTGMQTVRDETAQACRSTADFDGNQREFFPIFDAQFAEDYGKIPLGGDGIIGRVNIFHEPTWLVTARTPLRVEAWKWKAKVASRTRPRSSSGMASAGWVAELALRTIDGSIRRMFTNRQFEAWTFDGHTVIPRHG